MRPVTLAAMVALTTLTSCSKPNDVLVSRSNQGAAVENAEAANSGPAAEEPEIVESIPTPSTALDATTEPATPTTPAPEPTVEPSDEPSSAEFPPIGEDWAAHRLASLAPSPDEIGPGWSFDYGYLVDAAPADPDDALPGCDAPVPPTLDGLELSYTSEGQPLQDLNVRIGEGDPADAQMWVDTFRALADCELLSNGFSEDFTISDIGVANSDDSTILTATRIVEGAGSTQVLAVARVEGLIIASFLGIEGEVSVDDAETEMAKLIGGVLAKR
jgi:hypothetical protein